MTSNLGKRIARIEADAAKPFDLDTLTADDLLAGRLPKGAHQELVHLSYESATIH